jgi:hypothetical protein
MAENIHAHDEDLPQLDLSHEMDEVLQDLAEERGLAVGPIKHRSRLLLKYLEQQEQAQSPPFE